MTQQARDITQFIPKPRGRIYVTPGAEHTLRSAVQSENLQLDDADLFRLVGTSLTDFLDCDYMRRSAWFKSQRTHTFVGLQFKDAVTHTVQNDVRLVVKQTVGRKLVICAPAEEQLPDDYFETRVLEETRVLYDQLIQ